MKSNLQRYVLALSLGVRFALGAANSTAQPYPESAPAVSPLPAPAATRSASSARSMSAGADEGARTGQVIDESAVTEHLVEFDLCNNPRPEQLWDR